MTGFKTTIRLAIIAFLPFALVSCGSFNLFNRTAEPVQEETEAENAKTKMTALETELSQIKTDQSDFETKLLEKETHIKQLEGHITRLEKKITALERAKNKKPANFNIQYSKPADLYKRARNLLLEEDYINAATLFRSFIKTHPEDSLADNAVYWLAECHYSMGEYKKAIAVFSDLEKMYPKSEKVPDAILKTGYSYIALDDANRANHYLKKVLKTYPFSPAAEKAQEKLSDFK